MKELIKKRHFFAEIDETPYAVDIKDWNRSEKWHSLRCGKCNGDTLTECDAVTIPRERLRGMLFSADIALKGFGTCDESQRFIICDACGQWHKMDSVQTIGEPSIEYRCIFGKFELSLPGRLVDIIQLLFWETEKDACQIVAESIEGNGEYIRRLQDGLSDIEHEELFNIIDKLDITTAPNNGGVE